MDRFESSGAIITDTYSSMTHNSSEEEQSIGKINEPVGTCGIPGTIFNLTNCVIGTGTLAIPLAFYYSGYIGGIILLTAAWILSAFSMHLLTYVSIKTKLYTYKDISAKIGGKVISILVQLSVFCYTTGTCIAYPIFLGGFLPHICQTFAPNTILVDRHFWIMTVCFLVIFPISMFKNLSALKYLSMLCLVLVCYTACAVCLQTFITYEENITENPPIPVHLNIQMLRGFPFLTCAFTAHYNLLRFYGELKDRSLKRMNIINVSSTFIAFIIYLVVGVFGYLSLNPELTGNVLVDYSTDDIPLFIGCIGFAIVIMLSFPLVHHSQRDLFDKLMFSGWRDSFVRRLALSFILIAFCMFTATAIEKISMVLAYNGSIFGSLVVYIFPTYFAFKVGEGKTKWISLVVMIIGIILALIGIIITTLDQFGVFE